MSGIIRAELLSQRDSGAPPSASDRSEVKTWIGAPEWLGSGSLSTLQTGPLWDTFFPYKDPLVLSQRTVIHWWCWSFIITINECWGQRTSLPGPCGRLTSLTAALGVSSYDFQWLFNLVAFLIGIKRQDGVTLRLETIAIKSTPTFLLPCSLLHAARFSHFKKNPVIIAVSLCKY